MPAALVLVVLVVVKAVTVATLEFDEDEFVDKDVEVGMLPPPPVYPISPVKALSFDKISSDNLAFSVGDRVFFKTGDEDDDNEDDDEDEVMVM